MGVTRAVSLAALCLVLLSCSLCPGLAHTAQHMPAGQLDSSNGVSTSRDLLQASLHMTSNDFEEALEEQDLAMTEHFVLEALEEQDLAMTELEEEELAAEADADADMDEALSMDTEGLMREEKAGRFLGMGAGAWPTFGLVGERQAALYYGACALFSVFFFKNSGLRYDLLLARSNSHGKSARLGA